MITTTKKTRVFFTAAAVFFCAFTLFSCNIGLGGSVDVNPPELAITAPAAKSVVNGTITITGTASDDMGMSQVSIDLKGIRSGQGYSYPAVMNTQEGTWSLTIPTTSIVDDDYNIMVTATDLAKKKTSVERVIEVDNTAPVIVIERPNSTVDSTDKDSYGTELIISGNVVDDHDIEEMWFTTYDDSGNPIQDGTISFYNCPQKFEYTTGPSFYNAIYGDVEEVEKAYRYEIKARDSAGNVSTCFYLLEELNTLNSSNAAVSATAKNIHAAYKNKEFDGALIQALRNETNPIEHNIGGKKGYFTLKRSKTPNFTVSSMDIIGVQNGLSNSDLKNTCGAIFNKDNQITITLSSNLDGDAVAVYDINNNPLITVYAVQFDQVDMENGVPVFKKLTGQGQTTTTIDSKSDWYELPISSTQNKKTLNVRLDTSLNLKPEGSKEGIKTGKYYAIRVVGTDTAGNKYAVNDDPYVFKLEGKGAQPELTVTQPTEAVFIGIDGSLVITGYAVSHDDDDDGWVKAALYSGTDSVKFEGATQEAGIWRKKFQKSGATIPMDLITVTTETLDALFENSSGSKILTLKVTDKSEKVASKEINVTYDTGTPVITFSSVSPTVTIGDTEYVNGLITVKGSISDNEDLIGQAWYQINDGTATTILNPNSFNISIDTTQYPDNTPLTVKVTAKDRSGNSATDIKEINVNQASDKPQISLSNGDVDQTSFDAGNVTKNLFGTNQNNQFQGNVTDDDGIASVVLYTCKATETLTQSDDTRTTVTGIVANSTNAQFSVKHGKTVEGEYKGQFVVTDKNGKTTETAVFWFAVDNGSPQIAFDGTSIGQLRAAGGSVDVKLTLSDGSGAVTLTAAATSTDSAANTAISGKSALLTAGSTGIEVTDLSQGYTDTVTIPDASLNYSVTYTATDRYNNSSSVVFTFMVDNNKPTMSPINWGDGDEKPNGKPLACLDKTGQFSFNGTASDKVGTADGVVSAVKYKVVSADNTVSKEYTANGTGSFSAIIDFKNDSGLAGCADQDVTITVTAYDAAGNASDPQSITIGVDSAEPDPKATAFVTGCQKSTTITRNGHGLVETDTVKGFLEKKNNTSHKWESYGDPVDVTIQDDDQDGDWNWSYKVKNLPDGEYLATIIVTDKNGRSVTITDQETTLIDTVVPNAPDITAPTAANTGKNALSGSTFTFKGTASDTLNGSGAESVLYVLKQVDEEPAGNYIWQYAGIVDSVDVELGNWSFTLDNDDLTEGRWYLFMQTGDAVGLVSSWSKVAFDIDQDPPEINLDSTGTNYFGGPSATGLTLSGTVSDTNQLDDSEAVTVSIGETTVATVASEDIDQEGKWSVTIGKDKFTADTLTSVLVTAKDVVGKKTSIPTSAYRDTQAPTFSTTLGDNTSIIDSLNKSYSVSASDSGAGLASTGYLKMTYNGNTSDVDANTVDITFVTGNDQTVTFTTTDALGNTKDYTRTVHVDTNKPTLEDLPEEPAAFIPANGTFAFAPTAKDDISVASATVVATHDDVEVTQSGSDHWYSKTWSSPTTSVSLSDIPAFNAGTDSSNNGVWKFVLTVKDKAGNVTSKTWSFIVDVSAPTVTGITGYPKKTVNSASPYTFRGTAKDDGESGLKTVEYSLDNTTWSECTGDRSWYQDVELTTEGTGTIYIRAKDVAGNYSAVASQEFYFDKAFPEITLNESTARQEGTLFAITGNAKDSNSVASVTVVQKIGGNELSRTIGVTGNNTDWTTGSILPLKDSTDSYSPDDITQHNADGIYEYKVTVKDEAGKETKSATVTVTIDTTAPDAPVITTPSSDTANKGENAINVKNFRFEGTTADNAGGTGIANVFWKILDASATAPKVTDIDWNSSISGTLQSWSIVQTFKEGNTTAVDDEGTYKLYVYTRDKAGNASAITSRDFDVDMKYPTVKVAYSADDLSAGTNLLASGGVLSTNDESKLSLVYEASDTNGLAEYTEQKLTITRNGTPLAYNTDYTVSQNGDLHTLKIEKSGNSIPDGVYVIDMSAKDVVGKVTAFNYTISYDTKGPDIDVTSPDLSEWQTKSEFKINGTTSDDTGVQAVYYKYGTEGDWIPLEGKSSWNVAFALADVTQNGTSYDGTITFGATDTLGNTSTKSYSLKVDAEAPVIGTTWYRGQPSDNTLYNNGSVFVRRNDNSEDDETETIRIEGSVTDNYGISDVVLTALKGEGESRKEFLIHLKDGKNKDGVKTSLTYTVNPTDTEAVVLTNKKQWNWSIDLPFKMFTEDGTWTFKYSLTDESGQEATQFTSLIIDREGPTGISASRKSDYAYEMTTESDGEQVKTLWYQSTALKYEVSANDDTSGISTIEYSTDGGTNWIPLTLSESKYTCTVNFPVTDSTQGAGNTVQFRATDRAGNMSIESDTPLFDTAAPLDVVVKSGETGQKLVNSSADVVFYVEAKDAHNTEAGKSTGIKQVQVVKLGGTTLNLTAVTTPVPAEDGEGHANQYAGYYELTIPADKLTTGAIVVETTDNVGNKTQTTLFQLNFDDEKPAVTIANISDADIETDGTQVNGTIILRGTASDNQMVQRVKVEYSTDGNSWTEYAEDDVTGTYNWSVSVDTTELDDEDGKGTLYFRATAIDSAGNATETPATAAVLIDQNTDRPVITLNNMALTGMNRTSNPTVPAWFKQRTFYGNVTDDDGVRSLKVTYTKVDETTVTGTKDIAVSGSSFEFSFTDTAGANLPDGTYELTFAVTDESSLQGTTFTSAGTNKPRVRDSATLVGGKANVKEDTAVLVTLDTQAPTIGKVSITTDVDDSGAPKSDAVWKDSDYDQIKLGGSTKKFAARFTLTDTSGIKAVTDADATSGLRVKLTGAHTYTVPAGDIDVSGTTYTVTNIPADTGTGRMNLNITAQDNASATREDLVAVTVDNTAPVVKFTTTQSKFNGGASETLNGTVDTSAILSFAVSTSGKNKPDSWTEIKTGSGYWGLTFDGSDPALVPEHTKRLNNYLINLYSDITEDIITDKTYKTITDLYIWIKAEDACGNISDTNVFQMKVDPQGDIPVVTIESPEKDTTKTQNIPLVGGKPKVYGSAEDPAGNNLGITSIWIQLISERQSTTKLTFSGYDTITKFEFGKDEIDFLAGKGYNIYNMNTYVAGTSTPWVAGTSTKADTESYADYAIRVEPTGGSSWSLRLNESSEFNPDTANNVTTNAVGIRVWAKDADGILSVPVDRVMRFDADKPVIGEEVPLYVVQSSKAAWDPDETYSSSMQYKEGMYLTGSNWYLIGSVSDNAVKLLELGNTTLINNNVVKVEDDSVAVETVTENNQSREIVRFKYPLTMDGDAGEISFTITAQDDSDTQHEVTQQIKLKYDNKAPELVDSSDTENYGLKPSVKQSNYFYHLTSMVKETPVNGVSQSGLDKVAFYFLRRDLTGATETDMIYNPLLAKSNDNRKVGIDGAILKSAIVTTGESATADGTVVYDQGLYWLYKTVERSENSLNALTLTSANDNIHRNSLVQMGGALYTVDNVSGTSVLLSGNPDVQYKYALFALASIVDNTIQESAGDKREADGYYTKPINDDGDRMQEYIDNAAAGYVWSAYICSRNIPDGPIEIHYIAFDKAGNYSHGVVANEAADVYKTRASLDAQEYGSDENAIAVYEYDENNKAYVSNNAPRIAKVRLGTDLKGNGTIDDDEWYDAYKATDTDASIVATKDDNEKDVYDEKAVLEKMLTSVTIGEAGDASKAFKTLKGKTEINLDIVGGNGILRYAYDIPAATGGTALKGNNTAASMGTGSTDYSVSGLKNIVLQAGDLSTIGDSDNRAFKIQVWDSTEGTVQFSNSAHADVTLYLGVAVADTTPPVATISPFYWNSLADNSINGSDDSTTKATLKGHIELEKDLPTTFDGSSSLMDRDPKVSGEIVIKGHAHDNKLLKNIYMKVPGMNKVNSTDTDHFTGLTQHKTNGSNDGWYLMATYANGSWTGTDKWSDHGFKFAIDADTESFADGHDVDWTFTWDTSKINGIAAVDVAVQVMAEDWGKPTYGSATKNTTGATVSITGNTYYAGTPTYADLKTSTAGTTQTAQWNTDNSERGSETGYYRMDVVPYITSVTTGLSKGKYATATSRTSNGNYTVRDGEVVAIEGFNLGKGTATAKTDVSGSTAESLRWAVRGKENDANAKEADKRNLLTISSNIKSGNLVVTVNSITSLNNLNDDDAKGAYTKTTSSSTGDKSVYDNYYNRQPNGYNNNILTDDLVLDVWQFNSSAAVPISGKLEQPIMKINPSTKQIGFAFAHGVYFSMPGVAGTTARDSNNEPAHTVADSNETSYNYWCGSYDFFTSVAMTYDASGRSYAIAGGGDMNMDGAADRIDFMSSRFGHETRYQSGSADANRRIESIGMRNDQGTVTFEKQRVKSPSLVTTTNGTKTNIYLAYYDQKNAEIRYIYGQEGADEWFSEYTDFPIEFFDGVENKNNQQRGFAHVKGNSIKSCYNGLNGDMVQILDKDKKTIKVGNNTADTKYYAWFNNGSGKDNWMERKQGETVSNVRTPASPNTNTNYTVAESGMYNWVGITKNRSTTSDNDNLRIPTSAAYLRVYKHKTVQDFAVHGYTYYSDYNGQVISSSDTDSKPGQFVSLAVDQATGGDVAILVWYDESEANQCLWYTYNTNPQKDWKGHTITTDYTAQGWTTPARVFDEDSDYSTAGKYCQITVDAQHGVHIAAFDPDNSELVYAYRASYNDANGFTTCLVDGNGTGTIGEYLTLDVALDSKNKAMPQIGYYSAGKPKYATVKTAGVFEDGTVNDEFTGAWECSIVPTSKTVYTQSMQYNKINVAVWKNNSGQITTSKTGTSSTSNTENGYKSQSYGYCWGNGTSNAVLGYAVDINSESNAIETAQMR